MDEQNIDSIFDEMTSGLELELDCDTEPSRRDQPFHLTAKGTVAVNIDNQVRLLIREAATKLCDKLRASEMTVLPTPAVDGDPTDDFTVFSAQTLTDLRIERLGTLQRTIADTEIDAETAHAWISAANDIRLDVREALDSADPANVTDPEEALAMVTAVHVHDFTAAVSAALIATLRS